MAGFLDGLLPDSENLLDGISEVSDVEGDDFEAAFQNLEIPLSPGFDVLQVSGVSQTNPEFLNSWERDQLEASDPDSCDDENDVRALQTSSTLSVSEGEVSNSSDHRDLATRRPHAALKHSRNKRKRPPQSTSSSSGPKTKHSRLKGKGGVVYYHLGSEDCTDKRCTHCGVTWTPQWREGPSGPKTLCNACGMSYKKGRLLPGYRPAASPYFEPGRHSNYYRKVLELSRSLGRNGGGSPLRVRAHRGYAQDF